MSESTSPRDQALQRALQQIEKSFGKGSIMRLDESQAAAVDGISTGVLSLDLALGGCGVPRGRTVELFGPESSGKTTLALHIVAQAQKAGRTLEGRIWDEIPVRGGRNLQNGLAKYPITC